MTSYSEFKPAENVDRNSQQTVEKDKRFLIRQQLFYLFHAFRCTRLMYTTGQSACQNQHCIMMRNVVKHINKCQLGKECTFQHCPSSKEILRHWKNCNDVECQVCAPLRRNNHMRKQDNGNVKEVNGSNIYSEQISHEKELYNNDWRSPLFHIRQHFIAKLTDELLPVKVCEDVKNHPGYAEVNSYVKGFEIDIYQNAQNLNEYFFKLAEKFEYIYRNIVSRYHLKENANSIIVSTGMNQFENNNKQIEAFFKLIKSDFQKFYPNHSSGLNGFSVKKEEMLVKEEIVKKLEYEYAKQSELKGYINTKISSEGYRSIKQESMESPNSTDTIAIKSVSSATLANDSKMSPDSTSIPKKDLKSALQTWKKDELITMFLPIYQELFDDKESEPFKYPVNWERLEIPDYPTIVKHPMDLSTIKDKLSNGAFKDPWEVVDDFWLMFNNAWLYNKKTSKVYKMCNSLAKVFESKVDDIMVSCGYCCGREYVYLPQVLICCTPSVCLIVRDAVYYAFQNDKSNGEKIIADLTCDRYLCCEKCYNESCDEVHFINPENNSAPCKVKKALLTKYRNNVKENEDFVYCRICGRKWHKVCANYLEEIAKEAFACPSCVKAKSLTIRMNTFKAKSLPQNHLSRYLENRVNNFLKEKDPSINEIVIRVLSSSDKVVEVKPGMRSHYCETCEMSETFKYRLKAIFAFQEIDGQEVCFFGLHVQEYGSDCPDPNSRRVYVAYLDSIHYFNPSRYRTDVYHEFLIGYLEYVKRLGFTMAHIWACPPGEGDDYIFHMHPPEQRLPKPKRLQEWYIKMLDKAMKENIVIDYKDIFSDALHGNMISPTELPYFDGDYWPNALEDIFKEIDDESNKKRPQSDPNACQEIYNPRREIVSKNNLSKMDKKPKKRKLKKMNSICHKRKRNGSSDAINDVSKRVLELMERRKENFFVIRLHTQIDAANLPEIVDPDPLVVSDLMDGRDKFLYLAREKHLEFSSMRRAKFSTLVFCYELHQEQKNSILYTCNACSKQIEIRYTCKQCEDFELCPSCYNSETHPHPLFKIDPDEESSAGVTPSVSKPASEVQDTVRARMVRYSQSLQHACQCRDMNCRINFCAKMKGMIKHLPCCSLPKKTCNICQSFLKICFVHAKFCNDPKCQVPNCVALRFNWKQQGSQQRMQQAQLLRRRVALMQRGMSTDQTLASMVTSQPQTTDVNQPLSTAVFESDPVTKPNHAVDPVNTVVNDKSNTYVTQIETNYLTNHRPFNNMTSNVNYSADIRITDDDIRLVHHQYNVFHRNYPIKEEFQKYFGDWLNSSLRFKFAFDILLKKAKRPNETINTSLYQNVSTIREQPSLQKPMYQSYPQTQWQADIVPLVSYSQPYNFLNGDSSNGLVYDYKGMNEQRPMPHNNSGNQLYIESVPQNVLQSQTVLSPVQHDSVQMNMMPKLAFQPGQPYINYQNYMGNFVTNTMPQYLPQSLSNMPRFTEQMINQNPNNNNLNYKVAQSQNFHCLPQMQNYYDISAQGHVKNNIMHQKQSQQQQQLQPHQQQPSYQQFFSHNSQIEHQMSGTNSPIIQHNYGQMLLNPVLMHRNHQSIQQPPTTMVNPMLIPSNQ